MNGKRNINDNNGMGQVLQTILLVFSVIGGLTSLILAIVMHKKLFLVIASSFLIFVGAVVIIGYVADSPIIYTYPNNKTGMALPTGICFLVTGICLLILINEIEFKKKPINLFKKSSL